MAREDKNKTKEERVIHDLGVEIEKLSVFTKIDRSKAYKNVWEKIDVDNYKILKKKTIIWLVAASVVAFIFFGLYQSEREQKKPNYIVDSENIYIQDSKGEIIVLDTVSNDYQLEIDNYQVSNDRNHLKYNNDQFQDVVSRTNTIFVPLGHTQKLTLADGSIVHLNSLTKLSYPTNFDDDQRIISLSSGEILIEVVKSKKPFIIKVQDIGVKVLGTKFNVNAYEDAKVTLIEGSIRVHSIDQDNLNFLPVTIKPNQQFSIDYAKKKINIKRVNIEPILAWIENDFAFENKRLENIMIDLSNWYGCTFQFTDEQVMNLRYSGRFSKKKDIKTLLDIFINYKEFAYELSGNHVVLSKKTTGL